MNHKTTMKIDCRKMKISLNGYEFRNVKEVYNFFFQGFSKLDINEKKKLKRIRDRFNKR